MAHFAELDDNNVVVRVIVVSDKDTSDENGVEKEEIGVAFCKSLFGEDTKWVKTSYNANIRGKYAGAGDTYDSKTDAFIAPTPVIIETPKEETPAEKAPTEEASVEE